MNTTTLRLLPALLAGLVTEQIHGRIAEDSSPTSLLIKWRDGPVSAAAVEGNARIGATVKRNFLALGWQLVELPPGLSAEDGLRIYRELDAVKAVEPDKTIQSAIAPPRRRTDPGPALNSNDPQFNQQWNLRLIGVTNVWATNTGNSNVVVAVIDTGVSYTHPDLAPNMWRNPGETGLDANGQDKASNGLDDDANGYVDDVHGIDTFDLDGDPFDAGVVYPGDPALYSHGSACAGIIGASGDNGIGTAGINWTVSIMAIRLWQAGNLSAMKVSAPVAAFDYVIAMKRRGINIVATSNSWGTGPESQAFREALQVAGNEGIVQVAAVSNSINNYDVTTISFPAYNAPNVICVVASTRNDTLADFASYGSNTVHLAAPGVEIPAPLYPQFQGSSAAGPHVAGALALLKAAVPRASAEELKAAILGSVDQRAAFRGRVMSNGRLNVAKALARLTNAAAPAIVIEAHPAGSRTRPNDPIWVRFSRPMDTASVEASFQLHPSVTGLFEWTDGNRTVKFVPTQTLERTNHSAVILASAKDASGGTLDGNFSGATQGTPADDFRWAFGFPAFNDDFANAYSITGESGNLVGTTTNALPELDEPDHANNPFSASTVWYRWIAPRTGWFTFDTLRGSNFDTLLAIYSGTNLAELTDLGSNDNYQGIRSRASFGAVANDTYRIVVAGKSEDINAATINSFSMGVFGLAWYPTPPPGYTGAQFSPTSGAPGSTITLFGTNFTGATQVLFNGASASFTNALTNNLDLRITAVVPPDATSGPITILTPHGDVISANSFQLLPPPLSVTFGSVEGLELSWPATSGAIELESTDNLAAASWSPVTEPVTRTNGATRLTMPAGPEKRYFRLKAP